MSAVATFKRLHPAYRTVISLVAPIGTVVGMLLALNVIQPFGEDAFAAGVDRTAEAATAAVNLRYAGNVDFEAAGAFDYRSGRGRLRYDFAGDLRGVDVIFVGRQVYLKLAGAGRDWIHADLDAARDDLAEYAEKAGLDTPPSDLAPIQELGLNDPSQVLDRLRRASAVEEQGQETIFGVPTRRYHATVEPREAGEQQLEVTAWIDGSDLIRRLALEGDDYTLTMEFSEFGTPVEARPPAPANLRELEDVLNELLADA